MQDAKVVRAVLTLVLMVLVGAAAAAQDRAPTDPIPGADVKVGRKPPGGGQIVAQGTTDAQGNFVFTNLPAGGTYFLRITVAGKTHEIVADAAGQSILLVPSSVPSGADAATRGAKPTPGTSKKFVSDLGEIAATVEIGTNSIRGSINKARSNIKSVR